MWTIPLKSLIIFVDLVVLGDLCFELCFLQPFEPETKFEERGFVAKRKLYSALKLQQLLAAKKIEMEPNVHEPVRNSNEEFAIVSSGSAQITPI